ncbi:MAG: 1-phosphofructokinase family hexose kinase [Chloroflexi bacterium]|nr:1-phosphofructokinase family hexose kinase [Chloroflexota bacterium]
MILCVNLNAAIDKTIVVDHFELGQIHRPKSVLSLAGGKGCNVARVLNTLGQPAAVTGWVGGYAGQFILAQLRQEGVRDAFVTTAVESRTCTSVVDASTNVITEIYESGVPVQPEEVEMLLATVEGWLSKAQLLVLSGSLPPGAPRNIYAQLIDLARTAGVPTLLDASKDALQLGLLAQPTYVKPNQTELAEILQTPLDTVEQQRTAAQEVARRHQTTVILSLGKHGALLTDGELMWQAIPPRVHAISAVGSGDSLVAGFSSAVVSGSRLPDALRLGVACGTANTLMIGAGRLQRGDVDAIRPGVTVTQLETS